MKRNFLILIGFLMAVAAGCSANVKSIDFYEKNDEAREQKIIECRNKNFDDMSKKQQEDCNNAQKAEANIAKFEVNKSTFRSNLNAYCESQYYPSDECVKYVDKCFFDSLENSKSLLSYDEFIAIEEKCIEEYTSKNK
ncbi:hypothetical protein HMPREF9309_01612 [Campylobacter ureolyticus ACS-301-V-Sch3b]|uniref:Lipoprotein n=1 Tax=Campylobacter ureolyticus ACS-301-V-Sch3b TaxID=883165 RepID=S3XB95_9BACT|nr:EexN family lipoprotein [Campylobacter ureolyticus]EPH07391.1 hypothetical protein HMPREF9309_01612 [Campylobacter ureolyticus ACS-301-V-Sch3b]